MSLVELMADEKDSRPFRLELLVRKLFNPLELRNEKGRSLDNELFAEVDVLRDLVDAAIDCLSSCPFRLPFFARCSPTSSLSGSVQMTSHISTTRRFRRATQNQVIKEVQVTWVAMR